MKSFIIAAFIFSLINLKLSAQGQDSVIVGRDGLKRTYLQNGLYLTHGQLSQVLLSRPESAALFHRSESLGKVFATFALPVLIVGAIDRIFAWVLVPADIISNNNGGNDSGFRNFEKIAGITVGGLFVIGIPFIIASNSSLQKSIKTYNRVTMAGRKTDLGISVGLMGDGVGGRIRF